MSTDQHSPAGPEALEGYLAAMEDQSAPLLGHLVLYSIFEGQVTPADVGRWFGELGLDPAFAPAEIRAVDVFEKITGPSGVRRAYPIGEKVTRRQRREGVKGREATLMIRHVSRDGDKIVRHLVREVRDEEATRLSYDSCLAVCTFRRDGDEKAAPGAGSMQVTADRAAIASLPGPEQAQVLEMLGEIRAAFDTGRLFLTADRLRGMIRNYVESLRAIRVRPTGGVYFTGRQHAQTLAALRELVKRFGTGSSLTRIPLPDQEEMREMVISAFVTRSDEELRKLARDIAGAQRAGAATAAVQALHNRFRELQAAAAEHEQLLGGSIDDARATMRLVSAQLTSLLLSPGQLEGETKREETTMTELQPVIVPGVPGIRYEATRGRKTAKTFIGRVYERVEGGGMQLWACDHKHPDEAQALDCATAEAKAIAARALADYRPPDVRALRDAVAQEFGGMPVEFRDPG